MLFCEDEAQTAKFLDSGELAGLPALTTIVQWSGPLKSAPPGGPTVP